MPVNVVDASVIAAWLFGEPKQQKAYELMRDSSLMAPGLLPYELASVSRKKCLKTPGKGTQIKQALNWLFELDDLQLVDVDHQAVLELSLEEDITTYDASYLHLSRVLEVPLLTFDRKLEDKTR